MPDFRNYIEKLESNQDDKGPRRKNACGIVRVIERVQSGEK